MPQLPIHDAGASCSLTEEDAAQRKAEFADVVESGLRHRERPSDSNVGLVFDNRDGLEDDIRKLTCRESECCRFFSFHVQITGDDILLQVNAPADKVAYLQMLYEATDPQRIVGRTGSSQGTRGSLPLRPADAIERDRLTHRDRRRRHHALATSLN